MRQYYGTYWGCDWGPLLVLKNILRPKRFLTRLRYGNLWQTGRISLPLERDGIELWPGLFVQQAEEINQQHPFLNLPCDGYSGNGYIDFQLVYPLIHRRLLSYFGRPYYQREPWHHSVALPTSDMKPTRCMDAAKMPFNVGWHYDTPNLVQLVILLNDVTEKDSHMQYARGEHRRLRVNLTKWDYYYSDEYAERHFDVVKCIGPKGTAFLFDTNAPHRFFMVKHSLRAMVKVGYTPGNAMLWDTLK